LSALLEALALKRSDPYISGGIPKSRERAMVTKQSRIEPESMKIEQIISLALVSVVALAASVATVSADPQNSATPRQGKVKYVKKYVKITGSNIPVPVWVAEGPLPKTTLPSEVIRRMR